MWEHGKLKYKETYSLQDLPFGKTHIPRNRVCWPPLGFCRQALHYGKGLNQFKASALDITHGFNPQILTICIKSSCSPFGYPTHHHWNRQHQNWAHTVKKKKQPPKSHAMNAWMVKKNGISMAYFRLPWLNPRENDPTNQEVPLFPPQVETVGGWNPSNGVLVKHILLSLTIYWIFIKYDVFCLKFKLQANTTV